MSSDHDPIREWHAQRERAEFLLTICESVQAGKMSAAAAIVALVVAGVDGDLAEEAVGASVPQAPTEMPKEERREPKVGDRVRWPETEAECVVTDVTDHPTYGRVVWGCWDGPGSTPSYLAVDHVEIVEVAHG